MKLSNGFEVDIREDALDDWGVFKDLCEFSKGNFAYAPQLLNSLIGEDNVGKLEEYLKTTVGKVKMTDMMTALNELLENNGGQNSKK